MRNGELELVTAKATIFATGGAGRMYAKTTNGYASTGDGMAICYRAGIPLMDMEFIQFHPTSLKENGVLLSEAARGEGAYLLNKDGERFMFKYAPNKGELASRDVVSRAEWTEILEGRGVDGCVLPRPAPPRPRKDPRTSAADSRARARRDRQGRDRRRRSRSCPAMHYTMGGIATDKDGATAIPGVYAAGECACVSVHGANRLGGNSLLETIVFGAPLGDARRRTTSSASATFGRRRRRCKAERDRIDGILARTGGERAPAIAQGDQRSDERQRLHLPRRAETSRKGVEELTRVRESSAQTMT